ncbi:trimeric intracellular cation channel family protein [Lederbergia galactosidilytica]|uniref:Membrane protein n=1 Tax=Lederbergia galactosidilytica TaxID=217031 RepID=A0A177ZHA0_9BACI|nr:trimeric intracellular cation channel family protein [Lederbergia galactosidilytica]KRG16420.1 membrane protein [Virgibacillus soli]MBP1914250.1 putative membrane protein YeiH [Lederbergia galactosidilytica]OAK67302.1 membrane protein [Lederbergia galactosidilytica]
MTWEILNIIGTLAFAVSGALIAIEEDYDILGVFVLGYTTAFGGGLIRNLLIGIPIVNIWQQDLLFAVAFVIIIMVFIIPTKWMKRWQRWVVFFDAIGLGAFAIQGARYAVSIDTPLIAVIIAATITGAGGGMLRDVFAGRKPMIFHSDIYALWAALGGLSIGLGLIRNPFSTYLLLAFIVLFRMLSVYYKWNLPRKINGDRLGEG